MKILQVIPFFSPKFGGSVTVLYELSKELAKRNHEVTIITTDYGFDKQYTNEISVEGIKVLSFHCVLNIGLFLYSPSIKNWLNQNLYDYDIIHLHNFRSYQNYCVLKYARKYNIPYLIQAHGSVLPFFEKQNLKKIYDYFLGDKILRYASKFIAVSKIERDQYKKMGITEGKIKIIPNGIQISTYNILPEKGTFKKNFGILPQEKVILYLGRLHKRKGLDFLINSFSKLLNLDNCIKLVIAGPDDGYLDTMMNQIKELKLEDKVLITGPLSIDGKNEAFVDANVLVYPGIMEIFGLVPFEAIMCGTPVIVSNDCGCGEIIEEANCGNLIQYGDIDGLNEIISEIFADPCGVKENVKRGQKYINEYLNWKFNILKFEDLYADCLYNL